MAAVAFEHLDARGLQGPAHGHGCVLRWSCARLNLGLYAALLVNTAVPTVYTTTRIFFLGQLPSSSGVDIASQLYWVGLLLEVMREAFIAPLYHCLGETLASNAATTNKVRSGLLVTLAAYSLCSGMVAIFAWPLVAAMAQQPEHRAATVVYIRWEMVGAVMQGLADFMKVVFVLSGWSRQIYAMLLAQMFATVSLDYLLVSQSPGSLQLGVLGVAFSNIGSYTVVLTYALATFVHKLGLRHIELCDRVSWNWLSAWWKVGRWAAADAFVRNFCYIVFVVRMMNVLREPGVYWIANNFIWSWLLMPFTPLAELLKQDVAHTDRALLLHAHVVFAYVALAMLLVALWLLSMPLWPGFFRHLLNVQEPSAALHMVQRLLPAYPAYMLATLMDSVFYGSGQTGPLAIASTVTNVGVYGGGFLLFRLGVFTPSLESVAALFSSGIVVDFAVTVALYVGFLRQRRCLL